MTNFKKRRSIYAVLASVRNNVRKRPKMSSLTKRIFAMEFISEFVLIYPFYSIMFGERSGISAAGLGVLLATWQIVAVAAEVPTGVIADKISKKWSLVIAKSMQVAAFALWLFVPNFGGYMAGFVIWGIGEAFSSGAFQAYLYESLEGDAKKTFGKILARVGSMTMLAYATANLAAFAVGPEYEFLLVMSILASLVSVILCLTLPEKRNELDVELRPKIISTAIGAIRKNLSLRRIMICAIILQGMAGMLYEFLPVYYNQVGTPTKLVPLILAVTSGVTVLIFWWMHRAERHLNSYMLPLILLSTGIFALSFVGGVAVAVVGIFLFTRVTRLVGVHNEALIQHQAVDEARATIGSLYSFAAKLLSGGFIILVGVFAAGNQIVGSLRAMVILCVVVYAFVSLYFYLRRRRFGDAASTA